MARRLVEAGVRCVTLTYGRWDSHGKNFDLVRDHGGKLDQCLSALIEDLDVRGMLERRDRDRLGRVRPHAADQQRRRPRPLAAGELRLPGRRRHAHRPGHRRHQPPGRIRRRARPVHPGEVFATIYHNLGIDAHTSMLIDPTGRPQHLIDRPALPELV